MPGDTRVLVVENDVRLRNALAELIRSWGYEAESAPDGRGERHGEGVSGAHHPSIEAAGGEALCGGELRGHSRDADGERDFRAREGVVYGSGGAAGGVLRAGGRGHAAAG